MRYRALDANRDMTFGQGVANFLVNSPQAVAQAVLTKLLLLAGEWFLDVNAGTPYSTQVLGRVPVRGSSAAAIRDRVFRERILGTPGVASIVGYGSQYDPVSRDVSVQVTINTIYGVTGVLANFPLGSGPSGRVVTAPSGVVITAPGGEIISA